MGDGEMPVFVFACISCGKTVSGKEERCPRCGASFDSYSFECPFCGELISLKDTKCPSCGTEFTSFSEEVSETSLVSLDGEAEQATSDQKEEPKAPQEQAPEPVEYECPSCGKNVSENDVECPHCGAKFG